jgi:hypothetical protein
MAIAAPDKAIGGSGELPGVLRPDDLHMIDHLALCVQSSHVQPMHRAGEWTAQMLVDEDSVLLLLDGIQPSARQCLEAQSALGRQNMQRKGSFVDEVDAFDGHPFVYHSRRLSRRKGAGTIADARAAVKENTSRGGRKPANSPLATGRRPDLFRGLANLDKLEKRVYYLSVIYLCTSFWERSDPRCANLMWMIAYD